ncbi:hypothetical protein [Ottowia sp.]|uniref:hypothetical protein n=1 Tax=Ottowia sp. TaxID=1898956 RepID=UPI002CF6CBF2|nr:hypothetical protein [Ottowia sp.]HPZ58856.1 hypothetical protein [Ottowia sp.]
MPMLTRLIASCLLLIGITAMAAERESPMYILPNIEGLMQCDEAQTQQKFAHAFDAFRYCMDSGRTGAAALTRLMDTLEPGGPQGKVQVGYTLTVQLLELYRQDARGVWVLDDKHLDAIMRLMADAKRPLVLYLSSSHFDSIGALPVELVKNPDNLMKLADGQPLKLNYFGYPIHPYTLRPDEKIDVNHYRYQAMREIARRVRQLPEEVQRLIVAITLMGEVHQLFPDFENGTGNFDHVQVTDYDPRSVADFRAWLQRKYGDITQFNRAHGFDYLGFDKVPAPGKDIRNTTLSSFGEHYDAFAPGLLPVGGWLWDPQGKVTSLDLYVDGERVGPIERGLNRLDVYRARDDVTTPNVGFRHDLDFSILAPGRHRLQVVVGTVGGKYVLGERAITVVPRDQSRVSDHLPAGAQGLGSTRRGWRQYVPMWLQNLLVRLGWLKSSNPGVGLPPELVGAVHAWVDLPKDTQDVYYNPLARDWDEFRASQAASFLTHFTQQAVAAGLPAEKLYSHQVVPQVNSSWNRQLFAVDQTLGGGHMWRPGFNLYGGAVQGEWLERFLKEGQIRDYGVPEFNPQQWKTPGIHLAAMRTHYAAGARFISPYYLSLIDQRYRAKVDHAINRMELRPDNDKEGSAAFFEAIRTIALE